MTSIPNLSSHAGRYFFYSFPSSLFSDSDGSVNDLTFYITSSPDASSWMSFDPVTRTLSGTPLFTDAGVYTIQVIAEDLDPASANGTTSFTITFDTGLDVANMNSIVKYEFSYTVPPGGFGAAEGVMDHGNAYLTPDEFGITYHNYARKVTAKLYQNSKVGNYTITIEAIASDDTVLTTIDVPIQYHKNLSPIIARPFPPAPGCILAFDHYTYMIPKSHILEPENEVLYFSISLNSTEAKEYWVYLEEDADYIIVKGVPTNHQIGNYTATLKIGTEHTDISSAEYRFSVCINPQPTHTGKAQVNIPNASIGTPWEFIYNKSAITEPAIADPFVEAIPSPAKDWVSCTQNSTHIK